MSNRFQVPDDCQFGAAILKGRLLGNAHFFFRWDISLAIAKFVGSDQTFVSYMYILLLISRGELLKKNWEPLNTCLVSSNQCFNFQNLDTH